jgi:hypothetical protein
MYVPADVRTYKAREALYTGDRGPWLEHMVEDCGCSLEEATALLSNYELIPIVDEVKGHLATVLKNRKEIHIAIYRRHRRRNNVTAARILKFLQPLLDKEFFLVTKISPGEDDRFLRHLGFEPLGVTMEGFKTFILNAIRYPRPHHEHH